MAAKSKENKGKRVTKAQKTRAIAAKKARKPRARNIASAAEMAERLRLVEELMVRRVRVAGIEAAVRQRYNVCARQTHDYMRKVRKQWADRAALEDRSSRRDHMRESLNDVYQQAITRRVIVRGADGAPLLDERGKPVQTLSPDLSAATRVSNLLCKIDGLYQDRMVVEAGGGLADLLALAFSGK